MGRKKIQISRIVDQRNRQVTFTKRKFGLMKKAYELSVLCDCEIALIIFNSTNRLFQYASTDMDRVLLKYTEYSEPHESRTNTDILETLRKKGLNGCESPDLEIDDAIEPNLEINDKYRKYEAASHMNNRQRLCAAALPNHDPTMLSAAQGGAGLAYGSVPESALSRGALTQPTAPRSEHSPGLAAPVSAISHSGAGYLNTHVSSGMLVAPGNLSRTMMTRSPTPMSLGSDSPRDMHIGARNMASSMRTTHPSLHSPPPMVSMASPGLSSHSLGGYSSGLSGYSLSDGISVYSASGGVQHELATGWHQRHHQAHHPHQSELQSAAHPHMGLPSSGHLTQSSGLPLSPFQTISIKSERASPHSEAGGGMFQNEGRLPLGAGLDRATCEATKEYAKSYQCPIMLSRPPSRTEGGVAPGKRLRITDNWQR
ncbi:myocyte-specific enhancer factor 2B [Callorhinchus milii]|uniref:myocyte-specific enhancer factor 2B n=1 Tax=Callorhinchus milii TaxID=7868 RepID=UPI00045759BA|nr:myocyte-specific enhancer factor 2B [Callorhinchus milii]XP_042198684.1 myocyte-specific enhancer factor 2B [Callorhinchus milii]|eukprot:gi/632961876/ref/XP_007897002.1/ PREDICTED: myocyte-specific enhancer factor 2C-like [Callorhinchus milii]